jgi:hypothetical protein
MRFKSLSPDPRWFQILKTYANGLKERRREEIINLRQLTGKGMEDWDLLN